MVSYHHSEISERVAEETYLIKRSQDDGKESLFFFQIIAHTQNPACGCILLFSIEATEGGKIGPSAISMMDFGLYDC